MLSDWLPYPYVPHDKHGVFVCMCIWGFFLGCLSPLVPYPLPFFGRPSTNAGRERAGGEGQKGEESERWVSGGITLMPVRRGDTDTTEFIRGRNAFLSPSPWPPVFIFTSVCLSYNLPHCLTCHCPYHLSDVSVTLLFFLLILQFCPYQKTGFWEILGANSFLCSLPVVLQILWFSWLSWCQNYENMTTYLLPNLTEQQIHLKVF